MIHETQTMAEQRHPNLLPLFCCFVHGKQLWMVMPYMAGGSLLSVMQANFPEVRWVQRVAVCQKAVPVLGGPEQRALSGQA